MDWLGVVGLWLGAAVYAIKTAGLPLMEGAPTFLASDFWGYLPLALLSVAAVIFLWRALRPVAATDHPLPSQASPAATPAKPSPRPPWYAVAASTHSRWEPNMAVGDVATYLINESAWYARREHLQMRDITAEIQDRLHKGEVTGWGCEHPGDTDLFQVAPAAWGSAEIRLDDDYAFFPAEGVKAYQVKLARGEVEIAWPRPAT